MENNATMLNVIKEGYEIGKIREFQIPEEFKQKSEDYGK